MKSHHSRAPQKHRQSPAAFHEPISRRSALKVLGQGGALLTVPMFLDACAASPDGGLPGGGSDPIANGRARGLKTPVLLAINCAITAPNPHNTQAWQFRLLDDHSMELFVDPRRILPLTDPLTRQIHIGQGCFLEHLSIGAAQLGFEARVDLFPAGLYSAEQIGTRPVARVRLKKSGLRPDPLFAAMNRRMTNRTDYHGPRITQGEFERALKQTRPAGSRLEFIGGAGRMQELGELFYQAMATETRTIKRADESRIWFRAADSEIYGKRDGISLRGNGMSGFKLWVVRTFFLNMEKHAFHSKENQAAFLGPFRETIESSRGYVLFRTAANTQRDWVQVGRDYARFHLALTRMGLVMAPLSQVLQEYPEMQQLRIRFEKLNRVRGNEKIQMAVRIGRSDYVYASPRRDLRSMERR